GDAAPEVALEQRRARRWIRAEERVAREQRSAAVAVAGACLRGEIGEEPRGGRARMEAAIRGPVDGHDGDLGRILGQDALERVEALLGRERARAARREAAAALAL